MFAIAVIYFCKKEGMLFSFKITEAHKQGFTDKYIIIINTAIFHEILYIVFCNGEQVRGPVLQIFIPHVPVSYVADANQDPCLSKLHHRNRCIRLRLSSSRCSSAECSWRGQKDPCLGHGCHHYRRLRLCLRAVNNTVGLLGSQRVQRNKTSASTVNGLWVSTILLAKVAPMVARQLVLWCIERRVM